MIMIIIVFYKLQSRLLSSLLKELFKLSPLDVKPVDIVSCSPFLPCSFLTSNHFISVI